MAPQTSFSMPPGTPIAAGAQTTPNFTLPSSFNQILTTFTPDAPFVSDPTITFTLEVWRESSPGSGQFVFDHGATWQFGVTNAKTGQPVTSFLLGTEVGPLAGVLCQVRMNASKAFTTAIAITTS